MLNVTMMATGSSNVYPQRVRGLYGGVAQKTRGSRVKYQMKGFHLFHDDAQNK